METAVNFERTETILRTKWGRVRDDRLSYGDDMNESACERELENSGFLLHVLWTTVRVV